MTVKVELWYDQDVENPCEWGGWKVISFNSRHANSENPHQYIDHLDSSGTPVTIDEDLQERLDAGTAFWLSYYEHSLCRWSLLGEGPKCPWDTVHCGGLLVWQDDIQHLPEKYAENARGFLRIYTDWCNGTCFGFTVFRETEKEVVDFCGGFIGAKDLVKEVRGVLAHYGVTDADDVEFSGDAAYLAEHENLVPEKGEQ